MIKLFSRILSTVLALALCNYAYADADSDKVKAALLKNNPRLDRVEDVHKSGILGLYEVIIGGQLLYTDAKARYLINGSIYEMTTMRNLSDERARKLFAVDFDKLPFKLALKKVRGNGQRKMAYFTDPNCTFCGQLESEMQELKDVTLYLFLLTIFPGSSEKVQGVLCSKNQVQAWDDLMLRKILPTAKKCDTATEQVMQLSRKLNVNGTPALIFADGILVPGYKTFAEIDKALSAGKFN